MDKKRIVVMVSIFGGSAFVAQGCSTAARSRAATEPGVAACQALSPQPISRPTFGAGQEAPDFELSDTKGKSWSLRALRGRPVLLNFWASWCEPCRQEMPALEAVARRLGERLTVLTVNVDEDKGAAERFFPNGTELTVLLDSEKAVAKRFGTEKFPETFLLDSSGRIQQLFHRAKWDGAAAAECLAQLR
jgi:thiol-disulfide isomerase/thioredoxin